MMTRIYQKYFARNKPLRHYSEHILFASTVILIIQIITTISFSLKDILLFILFTSILPDIDGVIYIIRMQNKDPRAKTIINLTRNFHFQEAAILLTTYHKQFNREIIHNIIGFLVVVTTFIICLKNENHVLIIIFGAILTHFLFDLFDDYWQLKNFNNWLWPIQKIFSSS